MNVTILCFSPCGSTRTRADEIGLQLAKIACVTVVDLNKICHVYMQLKGDLLIVAMPIYNNSLPQCCKEWLINSKLNFESASICLVYGGVSRGNAMAECEQILRNKDINFVGGAILPTRHCYIDKNTCNCNDKDRFVIAKLIDNALSNIDSGKTLEANYSTCSKIISTSIGKFRNSWFPKPYTDTKKCISCGKCIAICPMGCIDSDYITSDKCLHCNACVCFCDEYARICNINKLVKFGIKFTRLFNKKYKII